MGQGHSHTHEHDQHTELEKLRILLPHWIEHNKEHAESFQSWATKARELGETETAELIEEAVERMKTCNQALTAASKALREES